MKLAFNKNHIIKTTSGIGIIIIISAIFGVIIFLNRNNFFPPPEETKIPQIKIETRKVFLTVGKGDGNPLTLVSDFKEGMTAFSLLKEKAEELNLTLETKTYDIGILIEAIGGIKNGQDGKYWLYYINGEMPPVAADKKLLKVGDKVEFKFQASPY